MDDVVAGAVRVVGIADVGEVRRWFEVLCAEPVGDDWDAFRDGLRERAVGESVDEYAVERFVEYVTYAGDPGWVVARVQEYGDSLTDLYLELARASEREWADFLAECGPVWSGREEDWAQFRDWFLHEAGARGVAERAEGFVVEAEGSADKAEVFRRHGVDVAADPEAFPEVRLGDSGEWVEYLDRQLRAHGY
ncbi:hypothetical protein [Actinokineospora sp. UTMC 2448]|uniref:hypothetical protein n=1 Tax=Actinokineospora sp. UTMC 2448 TaxID=2268449 RepID=UPI002164DD71|nr:hypothetical protein [Actinokineospora sp. UTMC 2448]UVS77584.1 hypothetical protein Actkin_01299 [Actinokineospora sp. UTMC 2448]